MGAGTEVYCNKLSTGQRRANFSTKNRAMPGKRLDFWESDWRRASLGLGDLV